MTTAPRISGSGPRPGSTGPVVRRGLAATVAVGAVAAVLGAVLGGAPALLGALVGTGMVAAFFALGAMVLDTVARLAPALSLMVALLTYALQVVLVGLVFLVLSRSGALDSSVEGTWVAGTMIVATFAWLAVQVWTSLRARIPLYDLGGPAGPSGPQQPPAPPSGGVSGPSEASAR